MSELSFVTYRNGVRGREMGKLGVKRSETLATGDGVGRIPAGRGFGMPPTQDEGFCNQMRNYVAFNWPHMRGFTLVAKAQIPALIPLPANMAGLSPFSDCCWEAESECDWAPIGRRRFVWNMEHHPQ